MEEVRVSSRCRASEPRAVLRADEEAGGPQEVGLVGVVPGRERGHEGAGERDDASGGRREMCKLLVSRGASLDARSRYGIDAEAFSRFHDQPTTADFLAAVRAAGGWAAYVQAPRTQLLALRRELPALRESGDTKLVSKRANMCVQPVLRPLRSADGPN